MGFLKSALKQAVVATAIVVGKRVVTKVAGKVKEKLAARLHRKPAAKETASPD
jgi:hypothetical protein